MIRFAPVLILSIVAQVAGSRAESADKDKKPAPPAKPSAAPAKPSPSPSAAPSAPAPAVPVKETEEQKALRERVMAYWKIRVTSNLAACHPFYEASFRGKYTPDQFATDFRRLNRFAPEFLGVDAVSIDASGVKGTAKVRLRTHPDVLQGQELISIVEEIWVREDGVWNKAGELTFPNI